MSVIQKSKGPLVRSPRIPVALTFCNPEKKGCAEAWPEVYVPIPAYKNSCVKLPPRPRMYTTYLIVYQLLVPVIFLQQGNQLYDIRIVIIKLVACPIEADHQRPVSVRRRDHGRD